MLATTASDTFVRLASYCENRDWAGCDPYDALNSELFARTPLATSRIGRLVFTQTLKRLPINLRPLFRVREAQNPKAIALFLMAFLKLARRGDQDSEDRSRTLIETLKDLRSENTPYWCWGYSFPWQTRTRLVPRGSPNIVCTTFVANGLLDAYEMNFGSQCLDLAVSAGEYILNDLHWTGDNQTAGFSYPLPGLKVPVHNANFLGAALLCRLYRHTGDTRFLGPAVAVARYSAARQREDGSWAYGEAPTQGWVDNFHTGYNLCALRSIGQNARTAEFEPHVGRGFAFYKGRFFTEDGAAKYFHDRTYPIDIHSVAQSIITLLTLRDLDADSAGLARSVYDWAMDHMWDTRGYFYYQVRPYLTNRISYIRWSQAWMLLALATLSEEAA
jgi:hypothetical protein